MVATRLYQNTAKVHFNQHSEGQGRFGRRLIYGGHVISLARALSFNGLANAFHIAAINGGRHVAPLFAGDTVFAWSEILETSVAARPRRCRRLARAHGRDQEPALRRFSVARGRGLRAERHSRSRLLGPRAAPAVTMRLPADATLIVIDVQEAIDDPRWGPRNNPGAEDDIASLIARWRAEGLPLIHVRHNSVEPSSPYAPGAPGHRFKACATPLEGERVVGKSANSAFIRPDLEAALDEIGATTLVICGVLTANSVEATARHAGDLGYQTLSSPTPAGPSTRSTSGPAVGGRGRARAFARPSQRRVRERRRHGGDPRRGRRRQGAPALAGRRAQIARRQVKAAGMKRW